MLFLLTVTVRENLCVVMCDDCRPIPGREFVEIYIKAYYLPETQLETWIYDHKVSVRNCLHLINVILAIL